MKKKKTNKKISLARPRRTRKKPELQKCLLSDCKMYAYMPRSYYKSRLDDSGQRITMNDAYDLDHKGRGIFSSLDQAIKSLSENKTYSKCLDELILLEVTTTNKTIFDFFSTFFEQYMDEVDYELVVVKEIDFKNLLALA